MTARCCCRRYEAEQANSAAKREDDGDLTRKQQLGLIAPEQQGSQSSAGRSEVRLAMVLTPSLHRGSLSMTFVLTKSLMDALYRETTHRLSGHDMTDLQDLFEDLVANAVGAGADPAVAREQALTATIMRARETLRLPPEA